MPGEQKSREAAHEFGRERPVVVILVGAPGQGKSSVAAKIKAAAGAVDVVILCQDDVPRNIKRNHRQHLERQLRAGLTSRSERGDGCGRFLADLVRKWTRLFIFGDFRL